MILSVTHNVASLIFFFLLDVMLASLSFFSIRCDAASLCIFLSDVSRNVRSKGPDRNVLYR